MRHNRLLLALAVTGALAFGVAACGDDDEGSGSASSGGTKSEELNGNITIDGSSGRSRRPRPSSSTRRTPA
jgi:ABC-type phosphate transport system substrate-binding protein